MAVAHIVCLMGPTASGKTTLSLKLAQQFPFEIINVDSAQVYQGMNIGTGKPSLTQLKQTPHHIIDFLDPSIPYSVAKFCEDAKEAIVEIRNRGRFPLLVGGTMLYFKALQQGLAPLPNSQSKIRNRLVQKGLEKGWSYLHEQLQAVDPISASRINPTDQQRIARALEIFEITNKPMSYWLEKTKALTPYRTINLAIQPVTSCRSLLHERIAIRFDQMLSDGFVEEVTQLLKRDSLDLSAPACKAVGYRQVISYLKAEMTFDEMREKAIAATRQLAKRQLTWLRAWENLTSFDFLDNQLFEKIAAFLKQELERV